MFLFRSLFVGILILLIGGCDDNIENKNHNESGIVKEYYETGKLKSKKNFKNGRQEGVQYTYWEDGSVKTKMLYKNGLRSDSLMMFFPSGKLLGKGYFKEGKNIGPEIIYHANGKTAQYSYYSLDGKLVYQITYNERGEVKSEEGNLTPIIDFNIDSGTVGDTFNSDIYLIEPPGYKVNLNTGHFSKNNKFINEGKLEIKNSKSKFQKILEGKEDYHWMILYEVEKPDGSLKTYKNDLLIRVE